MKTLLDEINQLDISERIQLVEDLWDSVAAGGTALPLTQAQREELDRRFLQHQKNPAHGVTIKQIAEKLNVAL